MSRGAASQRIASTRNMSGSTIVVERVHSEKTADGGDSRANAATSAPTFTTTRMRRITPRFRKSGKAGGLAFCLIIGRMMDAGMQASCPHAFPGFLPRANPRGSPEMSPWPAGAVEHRRQPSQRPPGPLSACAAAGARTHQRERRDARPEDPRPPSRRLRRLVGPIRRAGRRARQALHRIGHLRPPPGGRRHRRLARACADARGRADPDGAGPGRHRARIGDDPRRDRGRHVRLVDRPRGRPPQHRAAPDHAGR